MPYVGDGPQWVVLTHLASAMVPSRNARRRLPAAHSESPLLYRGRGGTQPIRAEVRILLSCEAIGY
jgi:hypothetical protein